ncbi:hypothetical protein [Nesterenkonia sp.]|uniref:hypothetical protein n=1 Tax=Nesterenkonia sp. TaxID=704201 RepID=UPI0026134DCF|nr:hypothetical protein [Nesterenkonia sp.]
MRAVETLVICLGVAAALFGVVMFTISQVSESGMAMPVSGLLTYLVAGLLLALVGWIIQVLTDVQRKARQS